MKRRSAAIHVPRKLHALVYDDPDNALAAVRALRAAGLRVPDVHTPFPVHGMAEAIGLAPTRLARATLAGAALGGGAAIGFQVWSHARSWPLDVGGKDLLALPALVPVTFELTVLLAAFATVFALILYSRLRPHGDRPPDQPGELVTDDRCVIVVEEADAAHIPETMHRIAHETSCERVIEGWRTL